MVLLNNYLAEYLQKWLNEILPLTGYDSEEGVYIYVLNDNNRNNKLDPPDVNYDFFIDETVK